VTELGPVRLATFAGGRGFVTYRDLGDAGAETIAEWVEQAAAHYRADPHVRHVEWKTRGHDPAPGLHEALLANGFPPDEQESIMIERRGCSRSTSSCRTGSSCAASQPKPTSAR
jgi:hypothetical protein